MSVAGIPKCSGKLYKKEKKSRSGQKGFRLETSDPQIGSRKLYISTTLAMLLAKGKTVLAEHDAWARYNDWLVPCSVAYP